MTAKSADDILGLEFDWIASDADGHVARFSTAGGGYAPVELLRDTDAHDAAITALLTSAARTKARFAKAQAPLPRDARERGPTPTPRYRQTVPGERHSSPPHWHVAGQVQPRPGQLCDSVEVLPTQLPAEQV